MIALVTSTLSPTKAYSSFSNAERLDQTLRTLERLYAVGFSDIYLFDNSTETANLARIAENYPKVGIYHSPQYTFKNKGLNESLLILNHIDQLPFAEPIFKISGRYYPAPGFSFSQHVELLKKKELVGIGSYFHGPERACFVTRAYYIQDRDALERMLVLAVEDMISYSKGIHGVRSFLNALKGIYSPTLGTTYQLSLEQVFARIAKNKNNYALIDRLFIEGYIAGNDSKEFVTE